MTTSVRLWAKVSWVLVILNLPLFLWPLNGQTNLRPGDLAIIGVNANLGGCGAGNVDLISFVCFRDITNGTLIDITDNGWERVNAGQWGNSEGFITVRRTGGTIPAGTVITFRLPPIGMSDAYEAVAPDGDWAFTQLSNATLNFNSGGDQIYFMQGGEWDPGNDNIGDPQHDATYSGGVILFGFNTKSAWNANLDNSQDSGLHPDVEPCYHMEPTGGTTDFISYSSPTDRAGQLEWIARISNPDNWTSYPDCPSYLPPPGSLAIQSGDIDLACTLCSGCDAIQEEFRFSLPAAGGPFTVVYTDGTNDYTATNLNNGDSDFLEVTKTLDFEIVSVEDVNGCPVFSNFGPGTTVVVESPPPAVEAQLEGCAEDGDEAVFNLTLIEEVVNLGSGEAVNWYADPGASVPIADPGAFRSPATTIYAVVGPADCPSGTVPIELTVLDNPTLSVRIDGEVACSGYANGQVSLDIIGGAAPYLIDWSDDAFDNQVAPDDLPAGTYGVTITDREGCQDSVTFVLGDPEPLALSCGQARPASAAGSSDGQASILLEGGNAPYEVSWTGPISDGRTVGSEGPFTIDNLPAGNYNLEVIDMNGCSISCSFSISDPDCPLAIDFSTQNVSCDGLDDGAIDLTVTGGTPPLDIEWDVDRFNGMEDLTGLAPGIYSVLITDAAGCTAIVTASVTADFPALSAEISPGGTACPGECFGFLLNLEGAAPFTLTYDITAGGNTRRETLTTDDKESLLELCPQDVGVREGIVEVTFVDLQDANCLWEVDQTEFITLLEEPVFNLDSTLCAGDSLVISGVTYNAAKPSGSEVISGGSINGCDSIVNINLSFTAAAELRIDSTLCEGSSIIVNGNLYDEGNPYGTEVIRGGAANGCDSLIIVDLQYQRDTIVRIEPALCRGESIMVNGTVYDESNPSGADTLTRVSGCDSILVIDLIFVDEVVHTIDSTLCRGESITVNGTIYDENNPSGQEELPGGSVAGCDSLVIINLRFAGGTRRLEQTLCEGESLLVNGTVYDAANPSGTETIPGGATGCDSTIIVDLSFEQAVTIHIDSTLCEGAQLTVGGTIYDQNNPSGTELLQRVNSGCDSTVNINLNFVPGVTALLEGNDSICPGDTAELIFHLSGAPSATIQYTDGINPPVQLNNISDGHSIAVSPDVTTTYTIDFVLVNGASCPAGVGSSATVEVNELDASIENINDFDGYGVSCFGSADGALRVVTTPEASTLNILWSTGATSPSIGNLPAGDYQVTVSNGSSCEVAESFTLTQPGEILVQTHLIEPTCPGDTDGAIVVDAIDGGASPYHYQLNGAGLEAVGDLPFFIRDVGTGNHELTVRDENGCATAATFEVTSRNPLQLDLGPDVTIERGDSIHLSPAVNFDVDSFLWAPTGGLQDPQALFTTARPAASITYKLTAFNPKGCSIEDQIRIIVEERSRLFIPNAFSPNNDGVNDRFTLFAQSGDVEVFTLRIFDRWGSLVFEREQLQPNAVQDGWDGEVRGQDAHPGVYVYFAEINYTDGTEEIVSGEVLLIR